MDRPRNYGGVSATIIAVPIAMIWFMLTSFGGFGCEGAVESCTPHYGTFLRGLAIIAGAAFALAILINAVIARLRQ